MTGVAYLLLDEAQALPRGLDLLVEEWPERGATAWAWQRGTARALLLRRAEPIRPLVPLAQTPQGIELGVRLLACQQRHGLPASYVIADYTAICHDCHAPWLWAIPWAEEPPQAAS